jgi:hypothetical protein
MRGPHRRATRASGVGTLVVIVLWGASSFPQVCFAQSNPKEKRFEFELTAGRLVAGDKTVRVTKGDTVELRWSSDRAIDLHLHGYDVEVRAAPDAPQVMRFEARATGRFPVEIHGSSGRHTTLIYVEVHPR